MKRMVAVICVLGAGAYFSANADAQDWDANCPRFAYSPLGDPGPLENEWQETNGDWTGLYLAWPAGGGPYYFQISPCNP